MGLLIAIALEQSVEWMHHRHQLHTAERNLHAERAANQRVLAHDLRMLLRTEAALKADSVLIQGLRRQNLSAAQSLGGKLNIDFDFGAPLDSSWQTARNNGAVALMSYEDASSLDAVYRQQDFVSDSLKASMLASYRVLGPTYAARDLRTLSPAELDALAIDIDNALAELNLLREVCLGLDQMYAHDQER